MSNTVRHFPHAIKLNSYRIHRYKPDVIWLLVSLAKQCLVLSGTNNRLWERDVFSWTLISCLGVNWLGTVRALLLNLHVLIPQGDLMRRSISNWWYNFGLKCNLWKMVTWILSFRFVFFGPPRKESWSPAMQSIPDQPQWPKTLN